METTMRCPTCETEQEIPASGAPPRCLVCGKDLGSLAAADAPAAAGPAAAPSAAKLAAALPPKVFGESVAVADDLRRGGRTFEWIVALIPVYGLVSLPRARYLGGAQRALAGALALASTLGAANVVRAAWPEGTAREALPVDKVGGQIAGLRDLVLQFREQTGRLPDEETWRRSVESADSHLFDPWGRAYVYERTAEGFRLGSLGRDGERGGEGENADKFESFEGKKS